MFNKWLSLHDKINDLEVENARLRQTIHFKNREIEDIRIRKTIDSLYRKIDQSEKVHDLEAELTYWKETAEYWKNECKEFDYKLNNQIKYNIYLEKELNKTLDK